MFRTLLKLSKEFGCTTPDEKVSIQYKKWHNLKTYYLIAKKYNYFVMFFLALHKAINSIQKLG